VDHIADQAEFFGSNFALISLEQMGEQTQSLDAKMDKRRSNGTNDTIVLNRLVYNHTRPKATSHENSTLHREPLPKLIFPKCCIELFGTNFTRLLQKLKDKSIYNQIIKESGDAVIFECGESELALCVCGKKCA
jgi:hypothetical protein